MNSLKQIGAVVAMNFRSLPQRLATSGVIVIGIAGVVGVLISVIVIHRHDDLTSLWRAENGSIARYSPAVDIGMFSTCFDQSSIGIDLTKFTRRHALLRAEYKY